MFRLEARFGHLLVVHPVERRRVLVFSAEMVLDAVLTTLARRVCSVRSINSMLPSAEICGTLRSGSGFISVGSLTYVYQMLSSEIYRKHFPSHYLLMRMFIVPCRAKIYTNFFYLAFDHSLTE
jgi:hypothetical protein